MLNLGQVKFLGLNHYVGLGFLLMDDKQFVLSLLNSSCSCELWESIEF